VVAFGFNERGDLCAHTPHGKAALSPIMVPLASVKHVKATDGLTLSLRPDGTLQRCEGKGAGTPRIVAQLHNVFTADGHGNHALACKRETNGATSVWTSGADIDGQLGDGSHHPEGQPGWFFRGWKQVFGYKGTVEQCVVVGADDWIVTSFGTYSWGEGHDGQLGDGSTVSKYRPALIRAVGHPHEIAGGGISSHGGWTGFSYGPTLPLLAVGKNDQGQLGRGVVSRFSTVLAPVLNSLGVLQFSGNFGNGLARTLTGVLGWGGNDHHQLSDAVASVPCGSSKGNVIVCVPAPTPIPGFAATAEVEEGFGFSFIVTPDGRAWSCGLDEYGQLGRGSRLPGVLFTPISLPGPVVQLTAGQHSVLALLGGTIALKRPGAADTARGMAEPTRRSDMLKGICGVEGCDRPHNARGWCKMHYKRWLANGDVGPAGLLRGPDREGCEVDGCAKPHEAHGYCILHYTRWKKYGDPLKGAKPDRPLTIGGIHQRMRRMFPKAGRCEYCGGRGRTDYASIGHVYTEDRMDWFELCPRCHQWFDGKPAGMASGAKRLAKTHCKNGHPWDEANTDVRPRGRRCRACAREEERRRRERKAAESTSVACGQHQTLLSLG
jgi:alpha-tubulin suppressor-like RCC1 family protein